jgi:hypothetical protein
MGHSTFTQELADAICAELADGKSLRDICGAEGMPAESTVRAWALDDVEGFAAQYARARSIGYEHLADEILAISDDGMNDTYTDEDGHTKTNQDVIARSRLRVDSRKWMLAKMLPKVYGDKVDVNHGGTVTLSIAQQIEQAHAARNSR